MAKVFISYSWDDKRFVNKLAKNLKDNGIETWVDTKNIFPGNSLPQRINDALEWCDHLVLVWSESAKGRNSKNLSNCKMMLTVPKW